MAEQIVALERQRGPIVEPESVEAGAALRSAIRSQDLDGVIDAKRRLTGPESVRPLLRDRVARTIKTITEPEGALDLGLSEAERAELLDDVLWFDLALGWHWFGPAAAAVLACGDQRWAALLNAVNGPSTDLSGRDGWTAAERAKWPSASLAESIGRLSPSARLVLAVANSLSRSRVIELHLLARKLLFDNEALANTLEELVGAGLAEVPASLRALAAELTLREIQDAARDVSENSKGTKAAVLERLLSGSHDAAVSRAVNARGWRVPIGLVGRPELKGVEAVASLWSELFVEIRSPEDEAIDDSDEWAAPTLAPPRAPTATWEVERPGWVHAIVARDTWVVGVDGSEQLFLIDAGRERWSVDLKRPAAPRGERPLLCDQVVVVACDRFLAAFERTTGDEVWRWRAPRGEELQGLPVFDGERVFQVSSAGVHAVDVHGGRLQWEFRRRDLRTPSVDEGVVVVAVRSEALHVLDAVEGRPLHRHRLIGLPRDYSPLLVGGVVVVSGMVSQRVATAGIDVHTGDARWQHKDRDARAKSRGRPGEVLLNCDWTVWGVDVATGKVNWKRPFGGHSAYVDDHGGVAVMTRKGIAVLSAADGKPLADIPLIAPSIRGIASFQDGSAIVAAGKHVVRAVPGVAQVTAQEATLRRAPNVRPSSSWSRVLESTVGGVAISSQVAVVATGDAEAFDLQTGQPLWRTEDLWIESVAADRGFVVGTGGEEVVALDIQSGELVWDRQLDCPAGAPLVIDGNDCFLVSEDATLFCFDVATGKERWKCRPTRSDDGIGGLSLSAPRLDRGVVVWADIDDRVFAADRKRGRPADAAGRLPGEQLVVPHGIVIDEHVLRCPDHGWQVELDGRIGEVALGDGVLVVSVDRGFDEQPLLLALR